MQISAHFNTQYSCAMIFLRNETGSNIKGTPHDFHLVV